MKAINRQFTEIINGNKQFIIPVFQRDFSWTPDQCEQLWCDVCRASSEGVACDHFMGSIVYISAGSPSAAFQSWLLIDGQQRMTTLTVLLIALRDHIRDSDWTGGEDGPTTDKIDAYYLKNTHESGPRRHKLVLRRKDKATLHALVEAKDLSEFGNDLSELVAEAYEFFRSALRAPGINPEDVYRGIAHLNVVDVTLDRGVDNPQLVFESMNSTGVDLRQSDLIRNYLLMDLDESDQTRLYEEYWREIEELFHSSGNAFDWFLRDYMALDKGLTQQIRLDIIYDEFKEFWNRGGERPLPELLSDMLRVARTYAAFLGIAPMQRPWLSDAMSHMRSLNTTQGLLIMQLYDCHEKNQLSQDEFVRAVELIESYLLRRAVLGLQTRNYWSVFAKIAHDLDRESVFESLQATLARLRGNYRFPSDEEFKRGLLERDLYGLRVCKHILDRLENAGHQEPSPVHNYSIEHIMPQEISSTREWQEMLGENWAAIHEVWLHRLGNLTLTAYNSAYSNRPFEEKQKIEGGFQDSAVRLNRDVRDQERWTQDEIEARGKRLANCACNIWKYHEADAASIQAAATRDLRKRAAKQNPDHLQMTDDVRQLLDEIRGSIREFVEVIEVIERKSICCYGPEFFAELMPMRYYVRVILPLEFSNIENLEELDIHDTSAWKFVPNRVNTDCDVLVDVIDQADISAVIPIIRQALDQSR
ncbi:MAG: DUF262 domain-containing protein [Gammaproteobacteria bacterium]|nr:DUF262 domain-containing protein [Gammaproteobacteria bacterium]